MALLKKYIWLPTILIPLLILFSLSISYGQEDEMVLSAPDANQAQHRPAVTFPHEQHMGDLDCLTCHHDYNEDGENILDEDELEEGNENILCSSCHDSDTDITLQEAFHRQCMGCHIKLRKAGKATGPDLCGGCHKKK